MMRLVHAAHDDVATMIVQEEAVNKFDRNMSKSDSWGPSIPEHAAKDKSQQIDVAVDFLNIRDNLESIQMQAAEANNPTSYLPKRKALFKPKMSTTKEKKMKKRKVTFVTEEIIEDQSAKGTEILTSQCDGKRKGKGNKVPTEIPNEEIQRKIDESFRMLEKEERKLIHEQNKRKQKLPCPNPPVVIFTDGLGISVCKGCSKKKISHEEITYPHNMVFQRCGIVGYYKKVLNKFINGKSNIHFHLKKSCL